MSDTEAEDNVPQAVKLQKKIKPKRIMTEEQLNRLAKMREKAQEVRKKKYEERQTELSAKKEAELEEKQLAEQEKIIAKAERVKNTEIVIRKKTKKKPIKVVEEDDKELTPPLAPNDSTYDIDNKIKEKFEEYKRQSQDDEVLKLIRHMMPNYK